MLRRLLYLLMVSVYVAVQGVDIVHANSAQIGHDLEEVTPQATPRDTGKSTGLALPRFVTLKSNETNWRNGPGSRYPIKWVYNERGYPVQVVAEFDNWRKVRDMDGEEGWVHEALVSGHRNVVIIDNIALSKERKVQNNPNELLLLRKADEQSYPVARLEFGVIAKVKQCTRDWCKIEASGYQGWARKQNVWGVMPDELIK